MFPKFTILVSVEIVFSGQRIKMVASLGQLVLFIWGLVAVSTKDKDVLFLVPAKNTFQYVPTYTFSFIWKIRIIVSLLNISNFHSMTGGIIVLD